MNLDLTEILKGCEGMTFYSLVNGNVKIEQVSNNQIAKFITTRSESGWLMTLDEFGRADKNGYP